MSKTEQSKCLTKKELAHRWGCSLKTVGRDVKRFGLIPAGFTGIQPLFDVSAVERLEARRHEHRMRQLHYKV